MGMLYDKEHKEAVCKRVVADGTSVAFVSRELEISENALHTWVKRCRQNSTTPFVGSGHVRPEDADLKRFMSENRELREDNEIFKKAAAYFAKTQK